MSRGTLTEMVEVPPPAVSQALKHRWAHFIKQVYETDPLLCPGCGGTMKIIAVIERPAVACLPAGARRAGAEGLVGPVPRPPGPDSASFRLTRHTAGASVPTDLAFKSFGSGALSNRIR